MELWKKIVVGISTSILLGYLAFSLLYHKERRLEPTCKQLVIEITDHDKRQFVETGEIRQFILRSGLNPEGEPLNTKRCQQIEDQALQHPMIRTASCYATTGGDVKLKLTQRVPALRVLGGENYFVDTDRRIMQVRSTTASDVPIITGRVTQRMAQEELYDFVEWLESDSFWSAQVDQINVVNAGHIELVPRVGTGVILLGSLDGYELKLRKLKSLYQDGFSKIGWKEYKEIDLRYHGQIVCR